MIMTTQQLTELEQGLCDVVDESFEHKQVPFLERLVNQPSHTMARPGDWNPILGRVDQSKTGGRGSRRDIKCRMIWFRREPQPPKKLFNQRDLR